MSGTREYSTYNFNKQMFERLGNLTRLLWKHGPRKVAKRRDLTMPCTRNSVWFSRWESPSQLLECMSAPEIRNDNLNLQAVIQSQLTGSARYQNVYFETMSYHERVSAAPTKYDRREGTAELDGIEARIVKLRNDLNPFLEIPDDALSLESRHAKLLLTNDIGVLERRQRQIFMDIGQEVSLQFEYPVQQITK